MEGNKYYFVIKVKLTFKCGALLYLPSLFFSKTNKKYVLQLRKILMEMLKVCKTGERKGWIEKSRKITKL